MSQIPDSVATILSKPTGVLQVGHKPVADRGLTKLLKAKHLWAPLLLGMGLSQLVDVDTGLLTEAFSRHTSATEFMAAPRTAARQVVLPSSPLLEAGRLANGSLDMRTMMAQWRDAGMAPEDAGAALAEIQSLLPVFVGKNDPLLEKQFQLQALEAVGRLNAGFSDVIERLKAGETVFVAEEDMEYWDSRINLLENSMAHDLTVGQLADRDVSLSQQINAAPDRDGVQHPLVQAGFQGGNFDTKKALDVWQRAGMPSVDAELFYDLLVEITASADQLPMLEQMKVLDNAGFALEHLEQEWQDSKSDQVRFNLAAAMADPMFSVAPQPRDGETFDPQDEVEMWGHLRQRAAESQDLPRLSKTTMERAHQELQQVIEEVGLGSFRPSLWQYRSPETVAQTADFLRQANRELQSATGWSGRTLGMDGRLNLTMGPVLDDSQAHAFVRTLNDTLQGSTIEMTSGWESLGHEWFHVFDHVIARQALKHPNHRPLTENTQLFRATNAPQVKQAMAQLNQAINEGSPHWHGLREKADKERGAVYFTRGAEAGAYAFGAFLDRSGAVVLNSNSHRLGLLEPQRVPSTQEQALHQAPFRTLFEVTQRFHLDGGSQVGMPSMSQWRQARHEPTASSASPTKPLMAP